MMTEETQTDETCEKKACCKKKAPFVMVAVLIVGLLAAWGYVSSRSTETGDFSSTTTQESAQIAPEDDVVIAKVNNEPIKISEAMGFINAIPQLQGQPIETIFPMVQEQLVSSKIVGELADKSSIENDPEVAKRMALAKQEIIRGVFIEKELDKRVTEERLQELYKDFLSKQPDVEEAHARHILVEKESEAKEIVKKLKDGADFATLAQEKSTGPSGQAGGDLGYFTAKDMVPEFSKATFALQAGDFTSKPVKTQFGWHVIKLEEKRMRPAPSYEEVKPSLDSQERRTVLNELLQTWKETADVEIFDLQGNAIEPASGEEATQ